MKVNFNPSDFKRSVSQSADLILKNRYFEQNPSLTEDGASLLARPGLRRFVTVGDGPIRGMESEAGAFLGDLFVASGAEMYRVKSDGTSSMFFSGLFGSPKGVVNMAITAQIGSTPEYMFFCDGRNLFVYMDDGYAHNTLTGSPANGDVIEIGGMYYRWTTGSLVFGLGTISDPWNVALPLAPLVAYANMYDAINATGVPGVTYTAALTENPSAAASSYTANSLTARAKALGAFGNSVTTTETGAGLAWTLGATMSGGGSPTVLQVFMPDDVGAIDVAVIASYVIVIPTQTDGFQGRFYWIDPGEIVVDPLNFATAERSPDAVYGVEVFGDQFWLPGESTTEVWYPSGNPDAPMTRLQGVVLDRGSWQNTAVAIHEALIVVDGDGGVFLSTGSAPKRVSTPGIEEQIRKAISLEQGYTL